MHQDNRLWTLIARKLSGEASEREVKELGAMLGESASDQYLLEILRAYWLQNPELQPTESAKIEESFNRIISEAENDESTIVIGLPDRRSNTWKKWLLAGSVATVAVVGLWLYKLDSGHGKSQPPKAVSDQREVVAVKGTRTKSLLPDGTQVWLNGDSKITYSNSLNGKLREVSLEGEAYFDVVKDPSRPFIVHTSGIDIKVLGTAFNVKSYSQESTIEATLLRGLLEVTTKADNRREILHPNEKLVFKKLGSKLVTDPMVEVKAEVEVKEKPAGNVKIIPVIIRPDSVAKEISWVYNRLELQGDSFQDAALKMERWYDVKISFRDEKSKKLKIRAPFTKETIEEALAALKEAFQIGYRINGRDIEIWSTKE